MRFLSLGAALLCGCVGVTKDATDPCASCPDGQACDADSVCRPLCNSASDCTSCDTCSEGLCEPLEDCDDSGNGTGVEGDTCRASAECSAATPICEDTCRGCGGDDECATRDASVPYCRLTGSCAAQPPQAPVLPPIVVSGAANAPLRIDWRSLASDDETAIIDLELEDYGLLAGAAGTLDVGEDGALYYDPAGAFTSLASGVVHVVAGEARIRDERDLVSATASITLNVIGVNDPPVVVGEGPFDTNTLDDIYLDVVSNDGDLDAGDDSQYLAAVSQPTLGVATVGDAAIDNGRIHFTPSHPTSGTYVIAYVIADAGGLTASGSVTVGVDLGMQVTIDSFTSSRDHIVATQPATLSWATTNADSCTLTGGGVTVSTDPSGTDVTYAPSSSEGPPTLTCDGDGGPAVETLPVTWQPALFVDDDAAPGGAGRTWEDAFDNLQAAIDAPENESPAEIWLKAGTYRATAANLPVADLLGNPATRLYGGFSQALTGVAGDPDTRPRDGGGVLTEPTTLDGDVLGDDPLLTDNSVHVVVVDDQALLDGLRLARGNGTDGGGLYANAAGSVSLTDVVVSDNRASYRGGGLYFVYSSATLDHVTVDGNIVQGPTGNPGGWVYGGGLVGDAGSSLVITDSSISNNQALGGNGFNGGGNITVVPGRPGGDAQGGGIYLWADVVTYGYLTLNSTSVTGNLARGGNGGWGNHRFVGSSNGSVGGEGGHARAGAIDAAYWSVVIDGGAVSNNTALGGDGGRGGDGGGDSVGAFNGGLGGDGGHAVSGGFALWPGCYLLVTGATLQGNVALGGPGGDGGNGISGGTGANGGTARYGSTGLVKAEDGGNSLLLDSCAVSGNAAIDSIDPGAAGSPGGFGGSYNTFDAAHFDLVCFVANTVCVEATAVTASAACTIDSTSCP